MAIDVLTGVESNDADDKKEEEVEVTFNDEKQDAKSSGDVGEKDGENGEDGEGVAEEEVDSETLAFAKLLLNPETRGAVLAGLLKDTNVEQKVSEGQSSKQIVKSVKDDLRKTLGDDWGFLADKLSPVFDGMIGYIANLEQRLGNQISNQVVETSTLAAEKFFASIPEAKPYEKSMVKLMEDFDPPKDSSKLQPYLKRLYLIAKEEQGAVKPLDKKLADKAKERIERNSQTVNLKGGEKEGKEAPKQYKTSMEAVQAAVEMLAKKGKR